MWVRLKGSMAESTTRRRAFTLVELLVVIGIIAVLMGILLPTLGNARRQARQTRESAAARQLITTYIAYAQEHRGQLIPGHLADSIELDDDLGIPLTPSESAKRWTWRLVSFARTRAEGLVVVNEQADALDRNAPMWSYKMSLAPSFGLNYFVLGGDQSAGGAANMPGWVRKITEVSQTSRQIVFASAWSGGSTYGYFKLLPPTMPSGYSAVGWAQGKFDPNLDPTAFGYVHPRWDGRAVVACLDGHAESLSLEDLRDMTRWSPAAARSGDPNWTGR